MEEAFQLGENEVVVSPSDPLKWAIKQWLCFHANLCANPPSWLQHLFSIGETISLKESFYDFSAWSYSLLHFDQVERRVWEQILELFVQRGLNWNGEWLPLSIIVVMGPWKLLEIVIKGSSKFNIDWNKQKPCIPKLLRCASSEPRAIWSHMIQHFDRGTVERAFWYLWSSNVTSDWTERMVSSEIWLDRCIDTYGDAADFLQPSPCGWTFVPWLCLSETAQNKIKEIQFLRK